MCDRTLEFESILNKKNVESNSLTVKTNAEQTKSRSAFYNATADIGVGIQSASQMLGKLTRLVKRQGLFDDVSKDIDSLIYDIKQQLTELNTKCDGAQVFIDSNKSSFGRPNQTANHNGTVVNQLKADLMVATKDFKSVLELRSNKMKEQSKRKVELTGDGLLSPVKQLAGVHERQRKAGVRIGSKLTNPYEKMKQTNPYSSNNGDFNTNSNEVDVEASGSNELDQLLVAPPSVEMQYYDSRAEAVNEVEKTIVELGGIFHRLSSMISEQQQMVERIDEDVENAVVETNNARDFLLGVYNSASSNRGMFLKLGAIFVIFIIFFTVFLM